MGLPPFIRQSSPRHSLGWRALQSLLTVALVAAALAPCPAQAQPDRVSLLLKWDHQFQFAGYYAAIWQGYYKEAGIEVELKTRLQPDGTVLDITKEVNEGRADFAIGATDILVARDKGVPLVILASIFQRSAHTLVSLANLPLSKPSDLRGLRISYDPSAPDGIETDALLVSAGITDTEVYKVPFAPGIEPLIEGLFDVNAEYPSAALWRAKELGVEVNLLYPSDYETPFYGDTLFTHERMVQSDPDLCRRFRDASLRGWRYAMDHPEEIATRIANEMPRVLPMNDFLGYLRFESGLVRTWMRFPEVEVGSTNTWRWASIYRQLNDAQLVSGKAELGSLVLDQYSTPGNRRPAVWFLGAFAVGVVIALGLLAVFLFTSWRHWGMPVLAAALILGAIVLVDRSQHDARAQHSRFDLANRLGSVSAELEGTIRVNAQSLRVLNGLVGMLPGFTDEEFQAICARVIGADTNVRSMIAAPGLVVKHVYPIAGNEPVLGLDYNTNPTQAAAAKSAIERRTTVVAGPVDLVQGGRGVVLRSPVFLPSGNLVEPETLWGLLGVALDFDALLASSGLLGLSLEYDVAMRGLDGTGEQGTVFFGNEKVFANDPVIQEVALPSGAWQIAATPRDGWAAYLQPDWTLWAVGSAMLSLVLMVLVFRARQLREKEESAQRLQAVEATRARAQALARVSTLRHDFRTGIVELSPEFCTLLGLEPEECAIGDDEFLQHVEPGDRDRILQLSRLARTTSTKYAAETGLLTALGKVRRVHLQTEMITDKGGKVTGMFVTVQDITEQHQAQAALRQSEERFALAMLGSSDSLWDVDLTNNNVYYSPRFKEMFSLGPDWDGKSGEDAIALMHPSDRKRVMAEVEAVLTGGHEKLEAELRAITPDGHVLNVLTRAHVARDELGNPVRMVGTNVDITPLKNAERETRRLLAQLQQAQKMEAIGHLAGGVAHDFNNILASILGFNELAMNGLQSGAAPNRLESYLREVESAGFRARDLVQQLLTFSRPDGAAVGNVSVASVVRDSLKMLRATVPSSIALESSLIEKDAYVCANAVQLHQVILNLVINARDAVGDTGTISVRMSRTDVGTCTCASCHQVFQGDYITVTVSDTGCGIPAEVRSRIFEPFYTSKEQGKGTGMGLSVVHGILHGFGGHLLLESEPGKGTAITLFLPPAPEQSAEAAGATTPMRALSLGGASILLAEDEDAVAGFMQEALEQAGYKVQRAPNGAEAWELFQADPARFDLVVTDQAMPLMSGSALAEHILTLRPGMPIILVSGYSETVSEVTAPSMGITVFLTKPTPIGTLLDAVNNVVEEMRSGETGA